jgi:ComF family protein
LSAVYVAASYQGVVKDAVWKLKFEGAQAAAQDMAAAMARLIAPNEGMVIVHAPTATSHIRRRGYDQARLLARALARQTGQPYLPCLVRVGQQRQVGASRKQRFEQLTGAFRVAAGYNVTGQTILLVDDVLTTGATLEAAAVVLKKAGAARVEAVVFARA